MATSTDIYNAFITFYKPVIITGLSAIFVLALALAVYKIFHLPVWKI